MVGLYFCEVSVNAAPSLYQVVPDVPDNKKLAVSLTSEGAVGMAYFFICMESDEITHPKLSVLVTKIVKLSEKYLQEQRSDFYKFFSEYDKRRQLDFVATFPQMKEFWQECKWYAENL